MWFVPLCLLIVKVIVGLNLNCVFEVLKWKWRSPAYLLSLVFCKSPLVFSPTFDLCLFRIEAHSGQRRFSFFQKSCSNGIVIPFGILRDYCNTNYNRSSTLNLSQESVLIYTHVHSSVHLFHMQESIILGMNCNCYKR